MQIAKVSVTMHLLAHWLKLPPGYEVIAVRPDEHNEQLFNVFINSQHFPEVREADQAPYATILYTEPKTEVKLI